jgi:hypothetical protein
MDETLAELSGEPRSPAKAAGRPPVPERERTRKHRRKRQLLDDYTQCLRREIHGTVDNSALIDREIRLLLDVLPCPEPT